MPLKPGVNKKTMGTEVGYGVPNKTMDKKVQFPMRSAQPNHMGHHDPNHGDQPHTFKKVGTHYTEKGGFNQYGGNSPRGGSADTIVKKPTRETKGSGGVKRST